METVLRWLENELVVKLFVAMLALLVLVIVLRLLKRAITRYISDPTIRYRTRKVVIFFGYFLALLILSLIFRVRLAGLTLFLGIAGAGVALALQEVILSVAGWLSIVFGNVYAVGDRIELGKIKGDVIDISILRTTLMEIGVWVGADLYSGRIVHISNSFVFKEPVYNFSGRFPFLWDEITVPVRYGSDHRQAREILHRVVCDIVDSYTEDVEQDWERMVQVYRIEKATIRPVVTLVATDNWLEFTVRYVVSYKRRRTTKDELYTRILDEFLASEGRVQFASATSEIVAFPDLTVRLEERPPAA